MFEASETGRLAVRVSDHDHIRGPASAPVTLVEYGDFECPNCGEAYPILKNLQVRMGSRLRFVYRNFPLTEIHPYAENAAEASEAAGAQGRFWAMHDILFENQDALDVRDLEKYAARIGLDLPRFQRDLAGHIYAGRVQQEYEGGLRSGVDGTPTFFINGERYDGSYDEESLFQACSEAAQEKSHRSAGKNYRKPKKTRRR